MISASTPTLTVTTVTRESVTDSVTSVTVRSSRIITRVLQTTAARVGAGKRHGTLNGIKGLRGKVSRRDGRDGFERHGGCHGRHGVAPRFRHSVTARHSRFNEIKGLAMESVTVVTAVTENRHASRAHAGCINSSGSYGCLPDARNYPRRGQ